ncbi:MAG: 4-hydroxythreonine-4-phosphate dehydrogenase PdxA [Opitutales bacterium]|jgi:4-hydroxythreonine-4-phosphate dehydrogenase
MIEEIPSCPIAITCGDPAGIGPEVVAGWAAEYPEVARDCAFIGPRDWCISMPGYAVPVGKPGYEPLPGRPDEMGARVAYAALEEAAAGCAAGRYCAVVTAPISKEWMAKVGFPYPGHTEFFAARWGGEPSMGFVGERLRIVLATWHIPLMGVAAALTEEVLARAVERAAALAVAYGAARPRIAVCGLNPHAGEGGIIGTEERDFIDPLLDGLRETLPGLSRCLPPDTVFHRCLAGDFDAAVALYHDQGLGPLKTLEFDSAVNVTLGLPHIRTSPDHGTAFGIAGKGIASPKSFANAVKVAQLLIRNMGA